MAYTSLFFFFFSLHIQVYYVLPVALRDGGRGGVGCDGNEVHRDIQIKNDGNRGAMENLV